MDIFVVMIFWRLQFQIEFGRFQEELCRRKVKNLLFHRRTNPHWALDIKLSKYSGSLLKSDMSVACQNTYTHTHSTFILLIRVNKMLHLDAMREQQASAFMLRLRFGGKNGLSGSMRSASASHAGVFLHIQKSTSLSVGVRSIYKFHNTASSSCICISGCNVSTTLWREWELAVPTVNPTVYFTTIWILLPVVDFYSEIMDLFMHSSPFSH